MSTVIGTQANPRTNETASQTNTASKCWCATLQTGPTSLKSMQMMPCIDFSIQTTTRTSETATQTENNPQVTHQTLTMHSGTPFDDATSPMTTQAQPPSMLSTLSTTTATTSSPALKQLLGPWEQWHSLPSQHKHALQTSQPLLLNPKPHCPATMSLPTTVATAAATTCKMTNRAPSSNQTTANTWEIHCEAVNNACRLSTAQKMELCEVVQMCSSERVVHLTKPLTLWTLAHKSAEYKEGILGINLENIYSIVDR